MQDTGKGISRALGRLDREYVTFLCIGAINAVAWAFTYAILVGFDDIDKTEGDPDPMIAVAGWIAATSLPIAAAIAVIRDCLFTSCVNTEEIIRIAAEMTPGDEESGVDGEKSD